MKLGETKTARPHHIVKSFGELNFQPRFARGTTTFNQVGWVNRFEIDFVLGKNFSL